MSKLTVNTNGRQGIKTHRIAPTDTSGTHIRAKADAGSVKLAWDHALNIEDNHAKAAYKLLIKLEWGGRWEGASLPGDNGFAFVQVIPNQSADDA